MIMPGGGRGRGSGSGENDNAVRDLQALILGGGARQNTPQPGGARTAQKIIIPGRPSGPPPGGGGTLVVADPASGTGMSTDNMIGESITTLTPPSRYRPPAGFMNEELDEDTTLNLTPQEMLSKLRSKAGRWYTLGKFIPALYKQVSREQKRGGHEYDV